MAGGCRTHSVSAPNDALLSPLKLTIAEMEVPHGGAHCVNDNGPGSTGENVELTVGPLEAPSLWSCGVGHQFHPNDAEKMYGCLFVQGIVKTLENGALQVHEAVIRLDGFIHTTDNHYHEDE